MVQQLSHACPTLHRRTQTSHSGRLYTLSIHLSQLYLLLRIRSLGLRRPLEPSLTTGRTILRSLKRIQGSYTYPIYIVHEFGHAAGLWHSLGASDAMASGIASNKQNINSNDKKAMKALYKNHASQ